MLKRRSAFEAEIRPRPKEGARKAIYTFVDTQGPIDSEILRWLMKYFSGRRGIVWMGFVVGSMRFRYEVCGEGATVEMKPHAPPFGLAIVWAN